jgi:hypothetical protein
LDAQSAGVARGVIRRDHGRSSFSRLGRTMRSAMS